MTGDTQNTAPELCPFCASNVVVLTADGRGCCIRCGAEADEWNRRDLAEGSISLEDHERLVAEAVAAAYEAAVNACLSANLADGASSLQLVGDEARGFAMGVCGAEAAIRALTPADAKTALEAAKAEAYRGGMLRAAEIVKVCQWGDYWNLDGELVEPLLLAEAIRAEAEREK